MIRDCLKLNLPIVFSFLTPIAMATTPSRNPSMILAFAGKGQAVGVDVGSAMALYHHTKDLRENNIVITGASSGAIMAAFFACRGFNQNSMKEVLEILPSFDKTAVPGKFREKTWSVIGGTTTAVSMSPLEPIFRRIAQDGACRPRLPFVIAAGNLEILDNRVENPWGGPSAAEGRGAKTYDVTTGDVFADSVSRPSLDAFGYRITSSGSPNNQQTLIGKACTYFVDATMMSELVRIPSTQRLCDLRLVEDANDMLLAMRASIAEPTFFQPYPESAIHKLRPTVPGLRIDARTYNGGFAMHTVVQDVKRLYPDSPAFGTGTTLYPGTINSVIRTWFLVSVNEQLTFQTWWLDAQPNFTPAEYELIRSNRSSSEDYHLGFQRTLGCLYDDSKCRVAFRMAPRFTTSLDGRDMTRLVNRGIAHLGVSFSKPREKTSQALLDAWTQRFLGRPAMSEELVVFMREPNLRSFAAQLMFSQQSRRRRVEQMAGSILMRPVDDALMARMTDYLASNSRLQLESHLYSLLGDELGSYRPGATEYFVRRLYEKVLRRSPRSDQEVRHWSSQIPPSYLSQVVWEIVSSQESLQLRINDLYQEALARDATPDEKNRLEADIRASRKSLESIELDLWTGLDVYQRLTDNIPDESSPLEPYTDGGRRPQFRAISR